jgi:hypothetical protein
MFSVRKWDSLFIEVTFQVVYALLPAIIPLAISILLIYLPFGAYKSRARIRLLEKDNSNSRRLINIFGEIERNVGNAVVDIIDDPGLDQVDATSTRAPQDRSTLSPVQHRIAASLNQLSIKKHVAYIEAVTNSHAVIVCRDVNRFERHRVGEGVVRHWAASFHL